MGAGGAAYAIGITLSLNGVNSIYIANRSREKAISLERQIKKNSSIFIQVTDLSLENVDKKILILLLMPHL